MRTGQDWFIVSLTQRQADATFAKCRQHFDAFKQVFQWQGEALVGEGWDYVEYDARSPQAFKAPRASCCCPAAAAWSACPAAIPTRSPASPAT
jgi:hypothetical protein